ncbi:MAG: hypothetical protein QG650_1023 [Patescibacteria group bacterium]|nr:hypothetical protein [Patescibacteria group bacterium]
MADGIVAAASVLAYLVGFLPILVFLAATVFSFLDSGSGSRRFVAKRIYVSLGLFVLALASFGYWTFEGYPLSRDVLSGKAFHAEYWNFLPEFSLAGMAEGTFRIVRATFYWTITTVLGIFNVVIIGYSVTNYLRKKRLERTALFVGVFLVDYGWLSFTNVI